MSATNWFSSKVIAALVSAVLLASLFLPSVAAATIKRDQFLALFSVICTSAGIKIGDAYSSEPGHQNAPVHSQQDGVHCPLCMVGGAPAVPCQALSFAGLFEGHFERVSSRTYSAPDRFFWHGVSPRGPPTTS
jgi:hypothetical protein